MFLVANSNDLQALSGSSIREYTRRVAYDNGVTDVQAISHLEATYRARMNSLLAPAGMAVVGEKVIATSDVFSPAHVKTQLALTEAGDYDSPQEAAASFARLRPADVMSAQASVGAHLSLIHSPTYKQGIEA